MSMYFCMSSMDFKAEIENRANYGGKRDALHLKSCSAFKLPFVIRVPAGFDPTDYSEQVIAHFRRRKSRMEAVDGVDFYIYELAVERVSNVVNSHLPTYVVVVERVYEDLLPLPQEALDNPALKNRVIGYKIPENPGVPTVDDPVIVTSHTADGAGWINYKIYVKDMEDKNA